MAVNFLNVISRIYKRFVHSNLTIYLMLFYLNLFWPIDDKITSNHESCVCVCVFTSIHREGFISLEQLALPGNRSTMLC